jgi:hypothetical protein
VRNVRKEQEERPHLDPYDERAVIRPVPSFGWGVFIMGASVATGIGTTRVAAISNARKILLTALATPNMPPLYQEKLRLQLGAIESLARLEGER